MAFKFVHLRILLAHIFLRSQGTTVDPSASKPNVLVILIDDMGYGDLGAFGSSNHSTPNIDAFFKKGMKFTHWVSAAPICTPSRAALQTGRYPIRTGCMGNVEKYRVIPTPSNPAGLDPAQHVSIATALKQAGYATGMSGKWHLGINGNKMEHSQDYRFAPNAHSYDTYLGAPYTNAPMCEMDADGVSTKYDTSQTFCFMMANETVVQQPLRLENFTRYITDHAVDFLTTRAAAKAQPWFFFMSYFHVHTPLFSQRQNRGRSQGGAFGDNVEELDDSVGRILETVDRLGFGNDTVVFLTSDNGPYAEEGWPNAGRTNVYDEVTGELLGRLRGSKGQVFEGGIRMPGAVYWPDVTASGSVSTALVSTLDIFPTVLKAAGVDLGPDYPVDGVDMRPVLSGAANTTRHDVFLHYCGFNIASATVAGRYKVFWAKQKWYTNDPKNASICLECCNGINPWSKLAAPATQLCGCEDKDLTYLSPPVVHDLDNDLFEQMELTDANWPAGATMTYQDVMAAANQTKAAMQAKVHPTPDKQGAGTCTAGLPAAARQPCCPGCKQIEPFYGKCNKADGLGKHCECDAI